MRIKEIKEPREGMIYKDHMTEWLLLTGGYSFEMDGTDHSHQFVSYSVETGEERTHFNDCVAGLKLIGALGITHRIEDGKLVEIDRQKVDVDTIIKLDTEPIAVLTREYHLNGEQKFDMLFNDGATDEGVCGYYLNDKTFWSVKGILGVTHEIVGGK